MVLVTHRLPDDVLPGIRDYPAGGLDPDEDPLLGAVRELAEETGIVLDPAQLEYARHLDFTNTRERRTRQFVFTVTVPADTLVTLTEHEYFADGSAAPDNGSCGAVRPVSGNPNAPEVVQWQRAASRASAMCCAPASPGMVVTVMLAARPSSVTPPRER
ncbi:hypothetical protein KAURM247S_00913 [Kitasatospora aureofaciens]